MPNRRAIYPGSFDPITAGHLDIIRRMQPLFTELVIVVANSRRKKYLFSIEERVQLIRENVQGLANVSVDKCEGLIVDYAKANGVKVIVRGLRAVTDFENEFAMAGINQKLYAGVETMIAFTRPEFSFIASNMVKEVAQHGGELRGLVPDNVIQPLIQRTKEKEF